MSTDATAGRFDAGSLAAAVTDFAWPRVVATGIGAFLAGYLLTVLVIVLGPGSVSGDPWGVLVLIAFVFYSAHNVPAVVDGTVEVSYLQYVAQPSTPVPSVPVVVYYAVPLVVLLATGAVVASRYGDDAGRPVDGVLAGLGASVGYVAVAAAGTFIFRTPALFGGVSRLDLGATATYGFAYPLVFVTFAAVLVQFTRYVGENRSA